MDSAGLMLPWFVSTVELTAVSCSEACGSACVYRFRWPIAQKAAEHSDQEQWGSQAEKTSTEDSEDKQDTKPTQSHNITHKEIQLIGELKHWENQKKKGTRTRLHTLEAIKALEEASLDLKLELMTVRRIQEDVEEEELQARVVLICENMSYTQIRNTDLHRHWTHSYTIFAAILQVQVTGTLDRHPQSHNMDRGKAANLMIYSWSEES